MSQQEIQTEDNSALMTDIEKQLETGMIETENRKFCCCISKVSRFNGWIFSRHPDGKWVSERMALPSEIQQAIARAEAIKGELCIDVRG